MSTTYKVAVNNIKKGSAIKIGTVTYRILSLAKDGTAEIFPIAGYNHNNVFPDWPMDETKLQNLGTVYRASNNDAYYCRALPFSTVIGPQWELELDTYLPFSAYLKTAGSVQQVWTPWQAKNIDTGTTLTITGLTGTISNRITIYKTSKAVTQSSGTFHWRLLSIEDIINYFNSYTITAAQLSEFLNNSNHRFDLAEVGVTHYLSSSTDWHTWFVDKGYYGLDTTAIHQATPVYKLNLTEYKDWVGAQEN